MLQRILVAFLSIGGLSVAFADIIPPGDGDGLVGITPGEEISRLYTVNETLDPLGTDLAGENVDLNSGQLSFRHVDVSIPGNSVLPVEFARTLSVDGVTYNETSVSEFGDWRIDVPRITTVLARQHGWPNDRCTNFGVPPLAGTDHYSGGPPFEAEEYWQGYHVHIPGKGSHELLERSAQNTLSPGSVSAYPVVTTSHWMVECGSGQQGARNFAGESKGESFILHTPDGLTYYFDTLTSEPQKEIKDQYEPQYYIFRDRFIMLATRVEDQYGNWVEYRYNTQGRLTAIEGNDVAGNDLRRINIAYNASGKVASVTANSRTWTYHYLYDNGHYHLDEVGLPDGRKWQFDLIEFADLDLLSEVRAMACEGPSGGGPGELEGAITHPMGATVSFTIEAVYHARANVPHQCTYVDGTGFTDRPKGFYAQSLVSKTISGKNMSPSTWTYSYSGRDTPGSYSGESGPEQKWVDVVNPDDSRIRYTFDIRADWHEGNLDYVDYYLDESDTSYYRRVKYYYDPRGMAAGIPRQVRANTARTKAIIRKKRQEIIQEGVHFNWEVMSWDIYDNPEVRREYSGSDELTKNYAYENRVADWWLGRMRTVTIDIDNGEGDPLDNSVAYEAVFNSAGNIQQVSKFGRLAGIYTWHANGLLKSIQDPAADPADNLTQLLDYYRGRPQEIRFPENGRIDLSVDANGWITSITNHPGAGESYVTHYDYDNVGRIESIIHPSNDVRAWEPTYYELASGSAPGGLAAGTLHRTRRIGQDAVETNFYDAMLRPVLTQRGTSYVRRAFDSEGRTTFESYLSTSPSEADGIRFSYDALGRLVRTERDIESGGKAVETIEYENGNQRVVTNARGKTTTYTYRNLSAPSNELLIRIDAPEGQTTQIERDVLGAMTAAIRRSSAAGSPPLLTRVYEYNAYRDLCRVLDPETGVTRINYGTGGLLEWQATGLDAGVHPDCTSNVPEAGRTSFEYDNRRRLTLTNYPDGTNDITRVYDRVGNVTVLENGVGANAVTWTYDYNGRNLIERETLSMDGLEFELDQVYDARGHLASLSYPGGMTAAFAPDHFGRPTRVGNVVTNVIYHPNDAVASYDYANGKTMQMSLNTRGLPDQLSYPGINEWTYEYDKNGNITGIDHTAPSPAPLETRTGFVYDGLDRLTAVDTPNLLGPSRFEYDLRDNLIYKRLGTRHQYYEYDADNRLDRILDSEGSGAVLFDLEHDARGNVTRRNGTVDEFTFDDANRMTSSVSGGDYVYDGHGRRVKITAPGGEVTYTVYSSSGQLVQEYKPALNRRTDFLYLGSKLVGKALHDDDAPGTISTLTAPVGTVTDSFGVSWSSASGADTYHLQRRINGGAWTDVGNTAATSHTFTSPAAGSWQLRVAACNSLGCAVPKTSSTFTVTKPTTPGAPSISGREYASDGVDSNGSFSLTFGAASHAHTYQIQRKINSGSWATVQNTSSRTLSQSGLGEKTYHYRARACNGVGCSAYTTSKSVRVEFPPPTPADIDSPFSTHTGIYWVTWDSSSGALSYQLQVKHAEGSNPQWETIYNGSATSKYITDPTQGLFYYRVRARKTVVWSGWSPATSTQVSTGEDCDDPPLMQGMTTEGEAVSDSEAVILGPPCPPEL